MLEIGDATLMSKPMMSTMAGTMMTPPPTPPADDSASPQAMKSRPSASYKSMDIRLGAVGELSLLSDPEEVAAATTATRSEQASTRLPLWPETTPGML